MFLKSDLNDWFRSFGTIGLPLEKRKLIYTFEYINTKNLYLAKSPKTCMEMFKAALFIMPSNWEKQNIYQLVNRYINIKKNINQQ